MKEPEFIKRDSSGSCISICRDGIEQQWLKLVNEDGLSYRKAAQVILESIEHVADEPGAPDLPTANAIIDIGRDKQPVVGNSHTSQKMTTFPNPDDLKRIMLVMKATDCKGRGQFPECEGCRDRMMRKPIAELEDIVDMVSTFRRALAEKRGSVGE